MRAQQPSETCKKGAISVSEMASLCDLSRARFYELVKARVFPPPCYDVRTRRPLYPSDLQDLCLRIRRTNTALEGSYVVFNNRRTINPVKAERRPTPHGRANRAVQPNDRISELVDGLRALGVTASEEEIRNAAAACYPSGFRDLAAEAVLKVVFRQLRKTTAA